MFNNWEWFHDGFDWCFSNIQIKLEAKEPKEFLMPARLDEGNKNILIQKSENDV